MAYSTVTVDRNVFDTNCVEKQLNWLRQRKNNSLEQKTIFRAIKYAILQMYIYYESDNDNAYDNKPYITCTLGKVKSIVIYTIYLHQAVFIRNSGVAV